MYQRLASVLGLFVLLLTACTMPAPVQQQLPTMTIAPTETTIPATEVIENTSAPIPTVTLPATKEVQAATPDNTPRPSATPELMAASEDVYQYVVQAGTPANTANFVKPDLGCDWMGVGGQVFNKSEKPVTGLIVEVSGSLDGNPVLLLTLTGGSTVLGPGGYEISLADQPIASQESLGLQLFDLTGSPLSEKVLFDTSADIDACEKNLVIINFREISSGFLDQYLPLVFKNGE